jgi:putative membrane protein
MGTADIVPGVSGGTIAFILGVYEQLVASIKTFTGSVLREALLGRFRKAIALAPIAFMLPIGIGIVTAAASLANLLSWLLSEHPVFVWAFFFGLVGASIFIVGARVRSWSPKGFVAFFMAAGAAYFIVGLAPTTTPETAPAFFISGAIAICAMILPGVSGSFLLIILGKYDQILDAVVQRDVVTLGIFFLGALAGIALFSRLLTWLFVRHHDLVILVLTGLMLGSLRKVWPWKETLTTRINSHGSEVPVQEANILPVALDETIAAVLLAVLGASLIVVINRIAMRTNREVFHSTRPSEGQPEVRRVDEAEGTAR